MQFLPCVSKLPFVLQAFLYIKNSDIMYLCVVSFFVFHVLRNKVIYCYGCIVFLFSFIEVKVSKTVSVLFHYSFQKITKLNQLSHFWPYSVAPERDTAYNISIRVVFWLTTPKNK